MRNTYTVVMTLHKNKHYQVLILTNNLFSQQLGWCASFLTLRKSWKKAFSIHNFKHQVKIPFADCLKPQNASLISLMTKTYAKACQGRLLTQKGSPCTDSLTWLPAALTCSLEISCWSSFSIHSLVSYYGYRYIRHQEDQTHIHICLQNWHESCRYLLTIRTRVGCHS